MGFMDKVKDFVAPIEEEDDYQEAPQAEKVEEVEPQSRYAFHVWMWKQRYPS